MNVRGPRSLSLSGRTLGAARRVKLALKSRLLLGGPVMIGPPLPLVALTFDDGPSAEHTPAILDTLAARGAKATFFLLGLHIEAHPEIARRVAREQEVGCHSYAHTRAIVKSLDAFQEDTARFRGVSERELGAAPLYYRFPWGDPGRIKPRDVRSLFGMTCVHWSTGSGDDELETDGIIRRVRGGIEPGAIFLLHDGVAPSSVRPRPRSRTVEALPALLDAIEERGYRAVTVGELLNSGT